MKWYAYVMQVGLMPGGINHPATTQDEADLIVHTSDVDIAFDICVDCLEDCSTSDKCILCRRCRMPSQSRFIKVEYCFHMLLNQ